MNRLTPGEQHELHDLCQIWNSLYGNEPFNRLMSEQYPFKRIADLVTKQEMPVMLKVKDGMKVVGRW